MSSTDKHFTMKVWALPQRRAASVIKTNGPMTFTWQSPLVDVVILKGAEEEVRGRHRATESSQGGGQAGWMVQQNSAL